MSLVKLQGTPSCFVCGNENDNPRSLGLNIFWDNESRYTSISFIPDESWCGYEGMVHGGLLAAIIDDAMAWSIKASDDDIYVTGKLTISFRKGVRCGKKYVAHGFLERKEGRRAYTSAVIKDEEGNTCVEGEAIFIRAK